jgi:hypothetical protein
LSSQEQAKISAGRFDIVWRSEAGEDMEPDDLIDLKKSRPRQWMAGFKMLAMLYLNFKASGTS